MMKLYMKCTTDRLELPLIVEDSPTVLANKLGLKPRSVATLCCKQTSGYHSIEIVEKWPDADGGLWYWNEHGEVVHEY